MITLYDFNTLDEKGKGDVVFAQGTFIDDRSEAGHKVQLYRLDAFYVEVYYDPVNHAIVLYRTFKSAGQLAPYLNLK